MAHRLGLYQRTCSRRETLCVHAKGRHTHGAQSESRRVTLVFLAGVPSLALSTDSSAGSLSSRKLMDAEFANMLVQSMASPAGTTRLEEYHQRCDELRRSELPRFKEAGACGHCGATHGRGAFRDSAYFDFETYIRGKALLQMAPSIRDDDHNGYRKRDTYVRNANIAIGSFILKHILAEIYTEDAEAMGISPFFSMTAANSKDSLLSASPELDSIRSGVKSLLEYFKRKGYMQDAGIAQFGVSSDDEFENHLAWYRGEPASLKYWLVLPVDEQSSLALQTEEGTYLGYISATIAAFLRRCGVMTIRLRRSPSIDLSDTIVEQSSVVRIKDLPLLDSGPKWNISGKQAWKPDPHFRR